MATGRAVGAPGHRRRAAGSGHRPRPTGAPAFRSLTRRECRSREGTDEAQVAVPGKWATAIPAGAERGATCGRDVPPHDPAPRSGRRADGHTDARPPNPEPARGPSGVEVRRPRVPNALHVAEACAVVARVLGHKESPRPRVRVAGSEAHGVEMRVVEEVGCLSCWRRPGPAEGRVRSPLVATTAPFAQEETGVGETARARIERLPANPARRLGERDALVPARTNLLHPGVETWPSGRRRSPAKGVGGKPSRGFESLRLRHSPSVRLPAKLLYLYETRRTLVGVY